MSESVSIGQLTTPDREWATPASRAVLGVVGAGGIVAAMLVPIGKVGLGWTLAVAVVACAIVVLGRIAERRQMQAGWLVLAVGLGVAGAVRDAGWLFGFCVVGAAVCLSLSVAGGRSAGELARGSVAVWGSGLLSWPRLVVGVWVAVRSRQGGVRIWAAVGVGAVLVLVFGALFAAADAAFAEVVSSLVPDFSGVPGPSVVVFLVVVVLLAGAAYHRGAPARVGRPVKRVRLVEWALPVNVLLMLFALFIGVQVAALFGGDAYVTRTSGLTYAQYARSGFWQLLAVTALTLAVIAIAARVAPRRTAVERGWLRGLLGGLTAATLVIVASALTRLWLYQETYGFTVLRLLVGVAELWLGLVCLMVLAAGRRLAAAWLPRAVLGSGLAALLGLVVLNPEAFIARWNVQRYADTGRIDTAYLGALSADAVPALADLPEPVRACVLLPHAARLTDDSPTEWNWARAAARDLLLRPHACET
ncbi:DUF4173 domain-containing protein [Actinokineospora sp. UTMC 2448]|uniref:DUF4153 domain-containing protein n=1 Tax=Actinokineospora sp. UTMC 2448 TaxID=2268449 RepID=UPI002164C48E|nr:DUF4173 domain-containing protein [Actinokineospora sp. UTMC 2448]UVS79071.1 hypothetical protein Actkin_02812 [Actinokineospora sp. UTMC 2448]